jgi:hypothetical protein
MHQQPPQRPYDEDPDQPLAHGDEKHPTSMRSIVRQRRHRSRPYARRCAIAITGALLSTLVVVVTAIASFSAQGAATESAKIGVLSGPSIISATPGTTTAALTWSTVQPPPESTAVTYYVIRDGEAPAGNCPSSTSPTSATGCTDSGLSTATHSYTVTAVWRSWTSTSPAQTNVEVAKHSQAITFTSTPPSAASVARGSYAVTATGGASGNAVTFAIEPTSAAVCSIAASTVSFTAVGICTINAAQAGDANHEAAPQAQQTFAVNTPPKQPQTIPLTPPQQLLRAAFNAWQLLCAKSRLVLVDVIPSGHHVLLSGAADRTLSGRRVRIVVTATGRTVAQSTVGLDGSFQAKLLIPPRARGATSYKAAVGTDRSPPLSLPRRIVVQSTRSSNAKLTITGRVTLPLTQPVHKIIVERRLSCNRTTIVARVLPRTDGRFALTVATPAGQPAAVYRLHTQVRTTAAHPKTIPTFTLPVAVAL